MVELLKLTEVARRMGISEPTARRYVKSGKLPSIYVGHAYRVRDVDVEEFLRQAQVRTGESLPKAGAPFSKASENQEKRRARIGQWLAQQGARRAIMSDQEILGNFERMASGSDREAITNRFEQEARNAFDEEAAVDGALATEFARGGDLLPKVESGPDLIKRASSRHKQYSRYKRAIRGRYSRYYRALESYNAGLFADGQTSDFVMMNRPPQMVEAMRAAIRALEQEAKDKAG